MAYIGQNLDRFSSVEKLDAITPATATGAGPYNLTKGSVAFTPSSADTMVVSIDGVIQYGNFSVSGSTITFDAALSDSNTCDFIYHMGTGFISTPVDNSVSTVKIVDSSVTNAKLAAAFHNQLTLKQQSKIQKFIKRMQFPCFDALTYCQLAEGRLEMVAQCANKIWDIHPIMPIVRAAGAIGSPKPIGA